MSLSVLLESIDAECKTNDSCLPGKTPLRSSHMLIQKVISSQLAWLKGWDAMLIEAWLVVIKQSSLGYNDKFNILLMMKSVLCYKTNLHEITKIQTMCNMNGNTHLVAKIVPIREARTPKEVIEQISMELRKVKCNLKKHHYTKN